MIGPLSAEQRSSHFLTALFRRDCCACTAQICNRQFHRLRRYTERLMGERYCDSSFDSRIFLLYTAARTISILRLSIPVSGYFRRKSFARVPGRNCPTLHVRGWSCHRESVSLHPDPEPAERERIRFDLRPAGWPADTVVILGAGAVTLRKGVDLFIACARRVAEMAPKTKFRFVWIGEGLDQGA